MKSHQILVLLPPFSPWKTTWWPDHIRSLSILKHLVAWWGYIDKLVQERHNSSELAMEFRLSCTNPLIWCPQDGVIDIGEHSFRFWLVAWWHETISWTNADELSIRPIRKQTAVKFKSRFKKFHTRKCIWIRSRNCGCLVTWFCYQLIAKPGNKTATVSWPDPFQNVICKYQPFNSGLNMLTHWPLGMKLLS